MKKIISLGLAAIMVLTMSIGVFAAPTVGNVPVAGTIQNTSSGGPSVGPANTFDVQIPSGVQFWVTQNTYPAVFNVDAAADTPNPNSIINNNTGGLTYKMCLTNFAASGAGAAAAATVASDLTLNLTGDLAAAPLTGVNLSGGYTNATYYTGTLVQGTPWTFGFTGSYANTLSTTGYFPTYTLDLDIDFV